MINIKPSDFSSDRLYTKMEELITAREDFVPRLDGINKDFKAVVKCLTDLQLFHSYMLLDIDYAAFFSWNNDDKILEIAYDGETKNIFEAKLDRRIEAHKDLPKLLDLIISRLNEIY